MTRQKLMDSPTTFAGLTLKMAPGTDSGYKIKNGKNSHLFLTKVIYLRTDF